MQQNAALAKAWYQKAVELGNADAAKALADRDDADMDTLYQLAVPLYKAEMYDAAYPLFEKAGQLGESRGLYYVGLMRQKGLGTAQDYDGAFAAYQQSADAGYDGALTALGTIPQRHGPGAGRGKGSGTVYAFCGEGQPGGDV